MSTIEWEEMARQSALACLPQDIVLYDFQIHFQKSESRIRVFLDKLSDRYGSPSVEDCENFSCAYDLRLQELAEKKAIAANYSLEVSSAGAERLLRFPQDMERFRQQPMKVQYKNEQDKFCNKILLFSESKEGISYWQPFVTRREKKKMQGHVPKAKNKTLSLRIEIKEESIQKVHLYIDI